MLEAGIRRDTGTAPNGDRALSKTTGRDSSRIPGEVIHDRVRINSLSHASVDRLWATWRRMPDPPVRPEPARTHGTMKAASVNVRARALLDLVAAGDQTAYEELYRLLSRRVFAFVRRMMENAESAEEIMTDTMYEVWRMADRYRGDSRVTTWVLGIARNKVLMALRSRPKGRFEDIDDFADTIDSEVPDGFALLEQKQTREMLQSCIGGLSAKHRECIHLTHFEEMSIREIGALLGIPEGTVKSRLSQARAQLAVHVSAMIRQAAARAPRHAPSPPFVP